MNNQELNGKTAIVTGASQGIGMGCARALAMDGATVVIMGRREDALAKARDQLAEQASGARIEMIVGDAVNENDVKTALAFAHGLEGHLDILVSTVGAANFTPLLMRELDDVKQEMDMNFATAFLLTRHGVPLMEPGGAIVCISTVAVTQAGWGCSIYSAAKAALERFVRAAAYELGGAGIRINAVRPGATLPQERLGDPDAQFMAKPYVDATPMGRIGDPDDIARVVRFLAGPDSGWVTGQTFSADGGLDQNPGPNFMDGKYGPEVMAHIYKGKLPPAGS